MNSLLSAADIVVEQDEIISVEDLDTKIVSK